MFFTGLIHNVHFIEHVKKQYIFNLKKKSKNVYCFLVEKETKSSTIVKMDKKIWARISKDYAGFQNQHASEFSAIRKNSSGAINDSKWPVRFRLHLHAIFKRSWAFLN